MRQWRLFDIFQLSLPIMLQNLLAYSLSVADTFMVGKLGEQQLSAVTAANSLFFVVSLALMGIHSAISILTAQHVGKENNEKIHQVFLIGLISVLLFTSLLSVAFICLPRTLISLIVNDSVVQGIGVSYIKVVSISYVFSGLSGLYSSLLQGFGHTRFGAKNTLVSTIINITLNWCLIYGNLGFPSLGVTGAAFATLLSRCFEVVVCVCHMRRQRFSFSFQHFKRIDTSTILSFAKCSFPVMVSQALYSIGTTCFTSVMGHLSNSVSVLASYSLSGNIERLLTIATYGLASAASIIVGKEVGANRLDRAQTLGKEMFFISFVSGMVTSVLLLLAIYVSSTHIFNLLNTSTQVREITIYMLLGLAIISPVRSIVIMGISGILRGGGDVKFATTIDSLPIYFLTLPLSVFIVLLCHSSIYIIFPIMYADLPIKAALIWKRFKTRRWAHNLT